MLIDKPLEWTSFDAVNKMKHNMLGYLRKQIELGKYELAHGQKLRIKIGHAGTLDPLASGLLIVCIGKQTKNIDRYMGMEKEYTGTFTLGSTTPTYDLDYCKKTGTIPVDFDGTKDALFPPRALDGRPHIEYLKDRGFFEDLPFDELRRASLSTKYIAS